MTDPRIRKIFGHYGFRHQLEKLKEECLELAEAADDFLQDPGTKWLHVEEEMADVMNVCEQFLIHPSVLIRVEEIRDQKLDRQISRIEKEKERGYDA